MLRTSVVLRTFKALGVAVDEAVDGRDAMRRYEEDGRYAVVLLDNQMPHMTGATVVAEMRARGFAGTIVGMTGDPPGSHERVAFEASGVNVVVDKDTHGVRRFKEILLGFAVPARPAAAGSSGKLSTLAVALPQEAPAAQRDGDVV